MVVIVYTIILLFSYMQTFSDISLTLVYHLLYANPNTSPGFTSWYS